MKPAQLRAELRKWLPGFKWTVPQAGTPWRAHGVLLGEADKSRRNTEDGRQVLARAYLFENQSMFRLEVQASPLQQPDRAVVSAEELTIQGCAQLLPDRLERRAINAMRLAKLVRAARVIA